MALINRDDFVDDKVLLKYYSGYLQFANLRVEHQPEQPETGHQVLRVRVIGTFYCQLSIFALRGQ